MAPSPHLDASLEEQVELTSLQQQQQQQKQQQSYHLINNNRIEAHRINAAYQKLETMRLYNLEVACQEMGIVCDKEACTTCLLTNNASSSTTTALHPNNPWRMMMSWKYRTYSASSSLRIVEPCLLCGAPTCPSHASSSFQSQGIVICHECQDLFELDWVMECLTSHNRHHHVDRLLNVYDRVQLLLQYAIQFIHTTIQRLEHLQTTTNKIRVASSSVQIVSGALGMAAAATATSAAAAAGTTLLLASLLFGTSATVVQTSTELSAEHSEPLANRILALHGIAETCLAIVATLRDALTHDDIQTDPYIEKVVTLMQEAKRNSKHNNWLQKLTLGRWSLASLELTAAVRSSAKVLSKTTPKAVRMARWAGAALATATVVLEAKNLSGTLQAIHAGNPCDKALLLKRIQREIDNFPTTTVLEQELNGLLQSLVQRERAMAEDQVCQILLEQSLRAILETSWSAEGSDDDDNDNEMTPTRSLLSRIETFKRRESLSTTSLSSSQSSSQWDHQQSPPHSPFDDTASESSSLHDRIITRPKQQQQYQQQPHAVHS